MRNDVIADLKDCCSEYHLDIDPTDQYTVMLLNPMSWRAKDMLKLSNALREQGIGSIRYSTSRQLTIDGYIATTQTEQRTTAERIIRQFEIENIVPLGYSTAVLAALGIKAQLGDAIGEPIFFAPTVRLEEQLSYWHKKIGATNHEELSSGIRYIARNGDPIIYNDAFGRDFLSHNIDELASKVKAADVVAMSRDDIEPRHFVRDFALKHNYKYSEEDGDHYLPIHHPDKTAAIIAKILDNR